jgi:molecular chaperone IbpA
MTGLTTFDINRFTPYAVGFDRVFDHLINHSHNMATSTGFPPYNIVKHDDAEFSIEMALAGLSKDDIEVVVAEGVITVKSVWDDKSENAEVLHRGISHKKFTRKFTIADDIEVKEASLENGLLEIKLERIIPDEKKPRVIKIK